jgi:hypothetical protein
VLALVFPEAVLEEKPPRKKKQEGEIYKHVVGFRMWHPAGCGWRAGTRR